MEITDFWLGKYHMILVKYENVEKCEENKNKKLNL